MSKQKQFRGIPEWARKSRIPMRYANGVQPEAVVVELKRRAAVIRNQRKLAGKIRMAVATEATP